MTNVRQETWAVARLKRHPENYKQHPPEQVTKLRESLRARGFLKPIVVHRERELIVAGHGIFEAALAEGFKEVPVASWSTTNAEADAYLVDDNELDRDAFNDLKLQAALLERLSALPEAPLYAFDPGDIDRLLASVDVSGDEVGARVAGLTSAGFSEAAAEALALAGTSATRPGGVPLPSPGAQPEPTAAAPGTRTAVYFYVDTSLDVAYALRIAGDRARKGATPILSTERVMKALKLLEASEAS